MTDNVRNQDDRTALVRPFMDTQALRRRVAVKAYELFEKRGARHGHDREDWLEAERLIHLELESEMTIPPVVRRPAGTPPSASPKRRDSIRSRN